MLNINKKIYFLLLLVFFGCTNANQSEENLKKLDKIYGYCDNPHREITGNRYRECKAREDAAGPDGEVGEPKSISEIFGALAGSNSSNQLSYVKTVNNALWQGAVDVLSPFPLKLIDSEIGYLETDWIYEKEEPNKRCLIKIQILSAELVSTGIKVNFTCQINDNGSWFADIQEFIDEEKKLTIKILTKAQEYQKQNN